MPIRCFAVLSLTLALTGTLFGQGTTLGSIVGTVLDSTGSSVPAARVRVLNTQTGVARETTTNEGGGFSALSLIPGIYSVEVTAPNFQKQLQENLKLEVAGTIALTFRLTVGQSHGDGQRPGRSRAAQIDRG